MKSLEIGKEEVKAMFADDTIIFIENPENWKENSELINLNGSKTTLKIWKIN